MQQRFRPFCWGLKCRLSDQKVSGGWIEFYPDCDATLVAKVLITPACLSESISSTEEMSSDESKFSVSYGPSGSEDSREETDEDYDLVCNQIDVMR